MTATYTQLTHDTYHLCAVYNFKGVTHEPYSRQIGVTHEPLKRKIQRIKKKRPPAFLAARLSTDRGHA